MLRILTYIVCIVVTPTIYDRRTVIFGVAFVEIIDRCVIYLFWRNFGPRRGIPKIRGGPPLSRELFAFVRQVLRPQSK